ncbi:MAG: L-aspartate oxidase [Flavobacteriales bacterium]|nr:L-aspartate oxidase [Flavobacteriales bacterium]
MIETDVLVIGSGISGLSYALKVAETLPEVNVTIVTKDNESESNTKYAQGGLAVVTDLENDSYQKHIEDTLLAGDGLCDREVVEIVVKEGPERFKEIINWGANFDKDKKGEFNLGREGGHTENRIVHHKDITGFEIERALLETVNNTKNITLYTHHYVIDLITEHHIRPKEKRKEKVTCFGAYVLDKKQKVIKRIRSKITLLATGGAGHVYKNSTNPSIATGDGIGLAFRAKAKIENMQFFQFHPTAFYSKLDGRLFLISEAVRGFGAKLRLMDGSKFMHKYDEREELASRDIVARAIDNELKISGEEFVGLDCSHLDKEEFLKHFPNIYEHCIEQGIDPFKQYIPVVPAAHYMCGGIKTGIDGMSSVSNLFAVGECTCTGLHGANRLASNSLLEALVFGHRSAIKTVALLKENKFDTTNFEKIPNWNQDGMTVNEEMVMISYLRKELQILMSDLVGIVRSNRRLQLAATKENEIYLSVKELYDLSILSPQLSELRNLVAVAHLIIHQSISQKENRGAYYNKDLEN